MAQSTEKDNYRLQRHYGASARLNLQHFLFKDTLGYLLHPDIPIHSDMKIADVATGTGIWLLDISRKLPSTVTLEGFDISSEQFPSDSLLPPNIKFGTLDASKEPPAQLNDKFDVVRVALLVSLVTDGNPDPWIQNLMRMVKPGGYLVWMEGNIPGMMKRSLGNPVDAQKHPNLSAYEAEMLDILRATENTGQWIAEIGVHFESCSLRNVKYEQYEADKLLWRAFTDNALLIHEEFAQKSGEMKELQKLKNLEEDLANGGVFPGLMPVIAIGQKLAGR